MLFGEKSVTWTTPYPLTIKKIAAVMIPKMKLNKTPETRTISLFQGALLLKASFEGFSSSSPSNAQYPPSGKRRIENTSPVFLFVFEYSFGPKPIANSLILKPKIFPAMKCPNSWTVISTRRTTSASNIYKTFCISNFSFN